MWDHLLGGARNFTVDRAAVATLVEAVPELVATVRAHRWFSARVTRLALFLGVDQFLELGCGLPTAGCCHDVLHTAGPLGARLVMVDNDPVAVEAFHRHLSGGARTATVVEGDLRDPRGVLEHVFGVGGLDPGRPVAIMATGVLHLVPGDLERTMAAYRNAMDPGSLLAVSHPGPVDQRRTSALDEAHSHAGAIHRVIQPPGLRALLGDWSPLSPQGDGRPHAATVPLAAWGGTTAKATGPYLDGYLTAVAVKPHPTPGGESGS